MTQEKKKFLVLCTGNSARSQMAEGLIRDRFGNRFEVHSAGTKPSIVRSEAMKVMAEIGIDISHHRSKSVNEFADLPIDYVLTVCDNAREECPYFPARTKLIHHSFDDPADVEGDEETRVSAFRKVRDEIMHYAETDLAELINDIKVRC